MNSLKPLLVFAVLVGICYGVYSRMNHKPDAPPPEAGGWDATPAVVEMGSALNSPLSPNPAGTPGADGSRGMPVMAMSGGPGAAGGDPRRQDFAPVGAAPGNWNAPPGAPPAGPGADYTIGASDPAYGQAPGGLPPAGAPVDPYGPPPDSMNPAYGGGNPAAGGAVAASLFAGAMEQVRRELDGGRLAEAHYQLSRLYDDARLSPQEQIQLNEVLDQLAGTVIYSTQNLLEPACEVQPGETLEVIAQRYNVPWQLLAKINGIDDPHGLRPGERLKVVRGPFNAVISLDKQTLTVMLNSTYAGRFRISIGRDHPPQEGQFQITEKVIDPTYYGPGRTIERGDPENPLGRRWLGLGNNVGIHGTNDPRNIGRPDLPGSINMSDRDVDDVFDILGQGSKVTIRR